MSLDDFRPEYVRFEDRDGVLVVRFTRARLSDEENVEQLGHELFAFIEQFDCRQLVLSLENVEYMTSSVLGKVISLHRKAHRGEGRLVLCCAKGGAFEILQTSRLLKYFNMADDVDSAVASFA